MGTDYTGSVSLNTWEAFSGTYNTTDYGSIPRHGGQQMMQHLNLQVCN